jgi:PAS domain S-box-containing protein
MGRSQDDPRWGRRLGGAISAVALVLLVESVVGRAATILLFGLAVVLALCGRAGRPFLLAAATVVLAADAFVLTAMPAFPASRPMTAGWLTVWALEGLLINALLIDILAVVPGRRPRGLRARRPRVGSRPDSARLKLLLESSDETKERFRLMVESLRDHAIVMLDPTGRIVTWNAGAERILGYSAPEMLGRDHALLYRAGEIRGGVPRRDLERACAAGTYAGEGWRRCRSGRRLWAQVGVTPLRVESGELRGFAMIIRDITRRRRAEEALRRARDELEIRVQERTAELAEANRALQEQALERIAAQNVLRQQSAVLQSILDSIGDALMVAEGLDRPLIVNPAACRLFALGPGPTSIEPGLADPMIRPADPAGSPDPAALQPLQRALQGETVDDLELTVRPRASDQPRWVLASGRPLRDPDGVNRGAVVVFRDITERRRDAQELKQAKEAAEAASRAKDQFLAVLSHELRTPLTPVLLAISDLMGQPDWDPEVRSTLAMIRRNVEVESRLIDDLLDLTRANTGRLTLDLASVDAHRIIQHAAEVCHAEIEAARLELRLELAAPRHRLHADPARLQQVFWNLIQNAVKFTPSGGRITVRTRNAPGSNAEAPDTLWVAEVADTGIGIDPARLPRIFQAFEQRDPVHRRRYGGLGLGLAISRSLVEAHGGRLTGFSAGQGRGSSFTIELAALPCARPGPPEADAPPPPQYELQDRAEALQILLIEDNADTLRYVSLLLRRRGHAVSTAPDFRRARELATSAVFDLIISDIELPDGSGLEIIREVNRIRPTPAIALSGFGSADDVVLSRDAGFAEHLTKPVSISDLEAAIARVVPRGGGGPLPGDPPLPPPTAPPSGAPRGVVVEGAGLGPRPPGPSSHPDPQPADREEAPRPTNRAPKPTPDVRRCPDEPRPRGNSTRRAPEGATTSRIAYTT